MNIGLGAVCLSGYLNCSIGTAILDPSQASHHQGCCCSARVCACKRLGIHVPLQRPLQKELISKPGDVGTVVFYYVISKNVKPLILVQTHLKFSGFIHRMKEIPFLVYSLLIRIRGKEKKKKPRYPSHKFWRVFYFFKKY